MKNSKTQKGITLIALIITIIVLLILAIVTIGAIKNDGIIQYAQKAKEDYTEKANEEQETLDTLFAQIGNAVGTIDPVFEEVQSEEMFNKTTNTTINDIYGNKIVIPAGFKILVDKTTGYKANDISVTKGVVIQDKSGNEFVWVPVGKIYTDIAKTEEKAETITLGRYESFVKNENGEYVPTQKAENYATQTVIDDDCTEDTADNHGEYQNAIAKDIGAFCKNTIANGGYYIGRFEAGDLESTQKNEDRGFDSGATNTLVCKAKQIVYKIVTQSEASSLSKNMYKDATTFTSDLINSYAWDTAIIFIQTFCDNCEDYYNQNFTDYSNSDFTGVSNDIYCNIYDMSGNYGELSTETSSATTEDRYGNIYWKSAVLRGGGFDPGRDSVYSAGARRAAYHNYGYDGPIYDITYCTYAFRPILYL